MRPSPCIIDMGGCGLLLLLLLSHILLLLFLHHPSRILLHHPHHLGQNSLCSQPLSLLEKELTLSGFELWTFGTKALNGVSAPRLSLVFSPFFYCVYLELPGEVIN